MFIIAIQDFVNSDGGTGGHLGNRFNQVSLGMQQDDLPVRPFDRIMGLPALTCSLFWYTALECFVERQVSNLPYETVLLTRMGQICPGCEPALKKVYT
jgi:hypothetical protein